VRWVAAVAVGVLGRAADGGGTGRVPPWLPEIDCEVLKAGVYTRLLFSST